MCMHVLRKKSWRPRHLSIGTCWQTSMALFIAIIHGKARFGFNRGRGVCLIPAAKSSSPRHFIPWLYRGDLCPNAPTLLPAPISLLLRQGVANTEMQLGTAPSTSLPLHRAPSPAPCHTKGLEKKAGICVGGQAAAPNTWLLFLCRHKKCVGNTTNEHLIVALSLPVISKLRFRCTRGRNCRTIAPKLKAGKALAPH